MVHSLSGNIGADLRWWERRDGRRDSIVDVALLIMVERHHGFARHPVRQA